MYPNRTFWNGSLSCLSVSKCQVVVCAIFFLQEDATTRLFRQTKTTNVTALHSFVHAYVLQRVGCTIFQVTSFFRKKKLYNVERDQQKTINLRYVAMCHNALQCVALCCIVSQCVAVSCNLLQCVAMCCIVFQCFAVRCSVLWCVAVCDSVLQCVAMCCSVLQCVANNMERDQARKITKNANRKFLKKKSLMFLYLIIVFDNFFI